MRNTAAHLNKEHTREQATKSIEFIKELIQKTAGKDMDRYWVNRQIDTNPNNTHEIHKEGCKLMPSNRVYLGYHSDCQSALREARNVYTNVDGCFNCNPECHLS